MEERKTSFNDLFCIRCGRPATGRYLFDDCPFCREEGVSANYSARIPLPAAVSGSFPVESNQPGIWKYRALYAVSSKVSPVSLEEGDTPLVKLGSLGSLMDLDELYAKDETRNPTWSHKGLISQSINRRGCALRYHACRRM